MAETEGEQRERTRTLHQVQSPLDIRKLTLSASKAARKAVNQLCGLERKKKTTAVNADGSPGKRTAAPTQPTTTVLYAGEPAVQSFCTEYTYCRRVTSNA
jgi:hypothetical protein